MVSGSLGLIWKVVHNAPPIPGQCRPNAKAMPITSHIGVIVVQVFKTGRRVTVVLPVLALSHTLLCLPFSLLPQATLSRYLLERVVSACWIELC
jgi:hypothetical protein